MITDLVIGGFFGFFGAVLLVGFVALLAFIIWYVVNKDYKYRVRIRNMSGGKEVMEWVKAKKIKHERLGEAYYMPSLITQSRALAPCLGSAYEFPLGKRWYVAFTYYNSEYAPEKFDPYSEEIERDVIKEIAPGKFEKATEKIKVFILRPVPKSIRKWVLDADRVANDENVIKLSWFERNKEFLAIVIIALFTAVVCFMAIIFSFQYATTLITRPDATPEWAIQLLNYTLTNQTMVPPTLG